MIPCSMLWRTLRAVTTTGMVKTAASPMTPYRFEHDASDPPAAVAQRRGDQYRGEKGGGEDV